MSSWEDAPLTVRFLTSDLFLSIRDFDQDPQDSGVTVIQADNIKDILMKIDT